MSTPQEKVETQRRAWNHSPIQQWHRHLIGPVELEHLLLTQKDHAALMAENELLKREIHYLRDDLGLTNEPHATTPKDPK